MISQNRLQMFWGVFATLLLLSGWLAAFLIAPVDKHQGEVYRIIYLHVPSALCAFGAALALFVFSILGLISKNERHLNWGRATAEVGLVCTVLCLLTGSVWGKPTWGTWWTWDARLTTTFILALLYAAYLMLVNALQPGVGRIRASGIVGILIFIDVPIIYKSVTWWRTLHQPQSLLRQGGSTMDPEMRYVLFYCMAGLISYAIWMTMQRASNLKLKAQIEQASLSQMR